MSHDGLIHPAKDCAEQIAVLEAQVQTIKAQLAAYNTSGFADADAMASAYLDMRARAESAEVNLENARKANHTWRCFHCDFTTSNGDEALAHFGERDDAEEFTPLCKWWSSMDDQERKEQFQALIQELNGERESNNTTALEAQVRQLREASKSALLAFNAFWPTDPPENESQASEDSAVVTVRAKLRAALAATEPKP